MITTTIVEFAAYSTPCKANLKARDILKLSFLDWMACGLAGTDEPVSRITRNMVTDEGGNGTASLLGGDKAPARSAALVNGATSHALDYDDTHFAHIGHPSVAVISAALAVGEAVDASGEDLQFAALIGAEASVRIGQWLGRNHYQTGFHQTATAGAFGAGLAAARLLGLDAKGCAMVLGLLATRASGLKSQFGTMGKPFNAGLAASNGVEAAQLVHAGFVANPDALECAQGFGPTHAGEADEEVIVSLGDNWIFESVSHKFHACCHGLHAVLEAAATLQVDPAQIAAIHVRTNPRWMTVCNQTEPDTGLGAKFSYATVLPMHFLGHDTARLDSYTDVLCADAQVQALRAKVQVTPDPEISETGTHLTVRLADGRALEATHDLNAPQSYAQREGKVRAKAASLLGRDRAEVLWGLAKADASARQIGRRLRG